MEADDVIKQIRSIAFSYSDNLMARHFDADYFSNLNQSSQDRLFAIIRSGIENPDSQMGAYAQHESDYVNFEPLLDPMIRDYHKIPSEQVIAQKHDWNPVIAVCNLENIDKRLKGVSMRVRVGRNVASFPLPGAMTRDHRLELEALMVEAFKSLQDDPDYGGRYLSLTPGSDFQIDKNTYQQRIQAHQMFKDMGGDPYLNSGGISSDWPFGRGMYIAEREDFIIWIGEEDHLRIMAMTQGGDLAALFARLRNGLDKLNGLIPPFAHSERYGFLTSCPTNLGTAMRASLHLMLPKLAANDDDLITIKNAAAHQGLAVRGAGGEHSGAGPGGLVDISPRARLGITETEIMQRLYMGAAALWTLENAE
jgi:hypothetical protein